MAPIGLSGQVGSLPDPQASVRAIAPYQARRSAAGNFGPPRSLSGINAHPSRLGPDQMHIKPVPRGHLPSWRGRRPGRIGRANFFGRRQLVQVIK